MYQRQDLITVQLWERGQVVDELVNVDKYHAAWFTHVLLENSYPNPETVTPRIDIRVTGWHWINAETNTVLTLFTCTRCHQRIALEHGSYTDYRWDEVFCYPHQDMNQIHIPN